MKCQICFLGKIKQNISVPSAELAQLVVKVKSRPCLRRDLLPESCSIFQRNSIYSTSEKLQSAISLRYFRQCWSEEWQTVQTVIQILPKAHRCGYVF